MNASIIAIYASYVACFLAGVAVGVAVQSWRNTRGKIR